MPCLGSQTEQTLPFIKTFLQVEFHLVYKRLDLSFGLICMSEPDTAMKSIPNTFFNRLHLYMV